MAADDAAAKRDVLFRALQVYAIQLDDLAEVVAEVSEVDLETNPVWVHTRDQKKVLEGLRASLLTVDAKLEEDLEVLRRAEHTLMECRIALAASNPALADECHQARMHLRAIIDRDRPADT